MLEWAGCTTAGVKRLRHTHKLSPRSVDYFVKSLDRRDEKLKQRRLICREYNSPSSLKKMVDPVDEMQRMSRGLIFSPS